MESIYGVDSENPVMSEIIEMIRDEYNPFVYDDRSVEVIQNEKAGKPKIEPPKRIWNPGIKIVVIRRRSIVRDYRRSLIIIIVVYYSRVGVIRRI